MNMLVTGDPDFISSNIAEYFSFKNHSVLVFNNLETGYLHNILKNNDITFIEGNICDPNVVAEAVKGIDYVFHYATLVSVPLNCKNPVEVFNINTLGTLNVLQSSLDAGVKNVIIVSSTAVYGNNLVIYVDDGQMRVFVREAKRAGDGRDSMAEVETISGWWRSEVGDGLMNMQYTRGVFTKDEVCLCQ